MSSEQVLKEGEELKKENPHPRGRGRNGVKCAGKGKEIQCLPRGALIATGACASRRGSRVPSSAVPLHLSSINMPVSRLGIFSQVLLLMNSTPNILL